MNMPIKGKHSRISWVECGKVLAGSIRPNLLRTCGGYSLHLSVHGGQVKLSSIPGRRMELRERNLQAKKNI